ncbi:MAG: hypothetical protein AB1564_12950, partial [Chloroflexota bacterium]
MNKEFYKSKNMLVALVCVIAVILLYSVDIFKLNYRLVGWKQFGETPGTINSIRYFMADTPNVIGYTEPDSGERVSCAEAVVFVETDTRAPYRCCDTGERTSCLAGDFTSDIPAADEECTTSLRDIFGIPASMAGTRDYRMFGSCPDGGEAEITVVQLHDNGQILWKSVNATRIAVVSNALRCLLAPLFLGIAIWAVWVMIQRKKAEP